MIGVFIGVEVLSGITLGPVVVLHFEHDALVDVATACADYKIMCIGAMDALATTWFGENMCKTPDETDKVCYVDSRCASAVPLTCWSGLFIVCSTVLVTGLSVVTENVMTEDSMVTDGAGLETVELAANRPVVVCEFGDRCGVIPCVR